MGRPDADVDALDRDADRANRKCRRVPAALKRLSRRGGARATLTWFSALECCGGPYNGLWRNAGR